MIHKSIKSVLHDVQDFANGKGTIDFPFRKIRHGDYDAPIRPSAAGKCARQIGFKILKPDLAEEITNRSGSTFLHGDVLHELERYYIRKVSGKWDEGTGTKRIFDSIEATYSLKPEGYGFELTGHIDGIISTEENQFLIDIKTMNDRAFHDTCKSGVDDGYLDQINLYLEMTGIKTAYLWAYNKNDTPYANKHSVGYVLGQRALFRIDHDPIRVSKVLDKFQYITEQTNAGSLPDRDYASSNEIKNGKPTGREYLPWQCGYCPFVKACWEVAGFKRVVEGGKVRWIKDKNEIPSDEEIERILG